MYKKGDRVVCIKNYDGKGNGLHGRVLNDAFHGSAAVEFDVHIGGHNGGGIR